MFRIGHNVRAECGGSLDARTPRRLRIACCVSARARLGGAFSSIRNTQYATCSAFTLMELILVMTVLAVAVALTAPALAGFFRGRTLDSEARRLLSMTRQG